MCKSRLQGSHTFCAVCMCAVFSGLSLPSAAALVCLSSLLWVCSQSSRSSSPGMAYLQDAVTG